MYWLNRLCPKTVPALAIVYGLSVSVVGQASPTLTPNLRVGIDGSYAPLSSKVDETFQGIDVDIAKKLGAALKRKVEFTAGTEDQLRTKLFAGDLDIVIAGTTATFGDRNDFAVVPYMQLPGVWIRSQKPKPNSPIKQVGTVSYILLREDIEFAKARLKINKVRGYEHLDTIIEAMDRGEVDAIPMDQTHAEVIVAKDKSRWRLESRPELGIQVYAMIRRDADKTNAKVQSQLAKLVADGQTQKICAQWFKRSCPAVKLAKDAKQVSGKPSGKVTSVKKS